MLESRGRAGGPTTSCPRGSAPDFNGPLLMAAELSGPGGAEDLEALRQRLVRTPGVAGVTPPMLSPKGDAAVMPAFPTTPPQEPGTNHVVHRLRDDVIPGALAGTGTTVRVGGLTAATLDFSEKNAERLPVLIGVVLLVSFLLLVVVFLVHGLRDLPAVPYRGGPPPDAGQRAGRGQVCR